ncbi:hypothetical protein MycrhN_4656 [Mycolicibacterium rhodesiae NBB3]|uniref:Uncharacterized protein n=1 Tax=Mycolicibacterium rhodesiae (strain NBB3) TaxID=710685 RepID=G8RQ69_MYCRN|nr:hypothetical protein [Mycolicibacterium rhodesiae]AEV75142.1 hypothetical protein MycrhN_4656 [Mycolicibacterium rhodesiae NBB3]
MRRLLFALVVAGSQTACGSTPGPLQAPFADGSTQAVAEAVDGVTAFPTELDPRIFTGAQMKPDLHDATLRIVDRIITDTGIKGLTVTGVELYGSNASYEYDDTSDFGVHVFFTSDSMTSQELAPIPRLLNDDVERRQEGHVRFYGIPVEVSFHAERGEGYQPQPGVGQYSITDRRWVTMPTRQPDHFDRTQMTADMSKFISAYNDLLSGYQQAPKGFDCSKFGALDDEMAAYRDEGFTEGLGSRSTQNLVYRALRRLNVSVPDMVDTLQDECTFVNESVG